MPRQKKSGATSASSRSKRGPGQPEKQLDLKQVEALCQLQVTDEELASVLGVSRKTIERRKEREDFREAMDRGRMKGLVSLRRAQYQAAINGNTTMLVWLGKINLNQRDPAFVKDSQDNADQTRGRVIIALPDGEQAETKPLNADALQAAGKGILVQ